LGTFTPGHGEGIDSAFLERLETFSVGREA
jgi:hypothetical protein